MTRKINGKFNGKNNDKTSTPPGIPDWLLAAFDVVITLDEIEKKGIAGSTGQITGQKDNGRKATGKGSAR